MGVNASADAIEELKARVGDDRVASTVCANRLKTGLFLQADHHRGQLAVDLEEALVCLALLLPKVELLVAKLSVSLCLIGVELLLADSARH